MRVLSQYRTKSASFVLFGGKNLRVYLSCAQPFFSGRNSHISVLTTVQMQKSRAKPIG